MSANKTLHRIWDDYNGKRLLLIALSLVLVTHGVIVYFTLSKTYDAYVHMFFADHYARFWFEPSEYRWYTGFLTISYPPLVHQLVALLSKLFPLKVAFSIYSILVFEVFVVGIYRFTKIFFDKTTAGVAAILVVVLSSMVETLHVFGQAPTITGLGFLLNALPFLYQYIAKRKTIYLVMALSFIAVVISSHHVTAIFGMVFFIAPTVFTALTDALPNDRRRGKFIVFLLAILKSALKKYKAILLFISLTVVLALGLIFPYWYWSHTDPITQVSIPHGSRDNFFEHPSSGLVFYIIPLSLIFALLPAITFHLTKQRRYLAWAVSFFLCLLLGSGGTTPLPEMLLGENAFNILTLDRFGFWASIIAIPFMAKFIGSFVAGPVKEFWILNFSSSVHFKLSAMTGFAYLLFIIFIFHLGSFRPLQPKEVEIQPIQNFLNRDDHMRWRYLTLGFGDQMSWLSANTLAATVDGNYHSARRLPELTSRPIERLENAKFSGSEGIASLNDFLTKSEKYSLKYIFSNDRYYDPLLYYTGWNRTTRLENGIMVWEKGNISTIKPINPTSISPFLKYVWGIFPLSSLAIAALLTYIYLKRFKERDYILLDHTQDPSYSKSVIYLSSLLPIVFFSLFMTKQVYEMLFIKEQKDPATAVVNYYNHLDFQQLEEAYGFFQPTPTYPIDQYLLEKSVRDGGLLSSYAKLDSIDVQEILTKNDSSTVIAYTRWNTAMGQHELLDTLRMIYQENRWYIIPPPFLPEIPDEQMRSYTYTLFKKQGKRVISSFPTVKDDRVKKPFAAFSQVNLIRNGSSNFVVGEILNADDIPTNVALRVVATFENGVSKTYYPSTAFQYNIAPKGSSFFQVDLDETATMDSLKMKSVEVYAETDVSERGYIHGGTPGYAVTEMEQGQVLIKASYYNEMTVDINIPGILIAEKDQSGAIWQAQLYIHPNAVRSGIHINFETSFSKIQGRAQMIREFPLSVFINGQKRTVDTLREDEVAKRNNGIAILPHCFISKEIFLH